jgi:hypothetical protein
MATILTLTAGMTVLTWHAPEAEETTPPATVYTYQACGSTYYSTVPVTELPCYHQGDDVRLGS